MRMNLSYLAAMLAVGSIALAQGAAPRGNASTTINGKKVSIDNGRPSLKGRTFADLTKQLPSDRIWRAGENQVTTIKTEGDLSMGGKKVAAGTYSIYVHVPESGPWSFILSSDLGVALGKIWAQAPDNMKNEPWPYLQGYTTSIGSKEVVRVPMKKETSKGNVENLTYAFEGNKLTLTWGDQAWSVDFGGKVS